VELEKRFPKTILSEDLWGWLIKLALKLLVILAILASNNTQLYKDLIAIDKLCII